MSKLIERIIRNVLTESLKTGWFFKILGGGTIRTNLADQLAVRLGAKQGVIVIATPAQKFLRDGVPPSEDIEAIISDVVSTTFQRSPVYSKFYDDNQHSYIFQVLKSKKRRKKFLFLIEQKSKYAKLINQIKSAEPRDGYFKTSANPDIDKIGTIPVMSGDEYRLWKSGIDKSIQNIESRSKQSDSNITPSMVDAIKKTYNSIKFLDVSKMKVRVDIPDVEATETIVTIDQDGFKGTARKTIDATGKVKYIPVEGIQNVVIRNTDIEGTFDGKFAENGMPEKGTVIWNAAQKDSNLGGVKTFRGILYTYKDDVTFQQQTIENPNFTFTFKEGLFEYWSGHRYRGAYISAENQVPTGQGFLDHGTSIADRNTITKTYNITDTLDFISVIEKEIGSGYEIVLPYVIGPKILFKGSFNPMPQNGSLLYKSSINGWGDESIIGTYAAGKFTINPDFKTMLDEAKQEIDAIKIFEDETGDLPFISIKSGAEIASEVSIPKSEVKDLILIKAVGDQGSYEFSYMNTDLNKRYPTPGKYIYQLNITDEISPNKNAGFTPEFIKLQKALGNIK